ncbi:MAG: type IV pilus secretin PilQ [Smithellaceae bacterium]|nr:type IV pilus secretin PilQ [Smithellaceae bacterium]
MKKSIDIMCVVLIVGVLMLCGGLQKAWSQVPQKADSWVSVNAGGEETEEGYLDAIAFRKIDGKERIILSVSKLPDIHVQEQKGKTVLIRLDNILAPSDVRKPLEFGPNDNVSRISATQKTDDGISSVDLAVELKELVPFVIKPDQGNVIIDFNTGSLAKKASSGAETMQPKPMVPAPAPVSSAPVSAKPRLLASGPAVPVPVAAKPAPKMEPAASIPEKTGSDEVPPAVSGSQKLIDVDFQDADIKSVLRLLAEIGGINIVSGDDVKGRVTVTIRRVPWEEALDIILNIRGLTKRRTGNVISVMTMQEMAKQQTQQLGVKSTEPLSTRIININYADAEKLQKNLEDFLAHDEKGKPIGSIKVDTHNNALIIQGIQDDFNRIIPMIEKIDRPTHQVRIKANIVETTKDTARNLGIQWGGMYGRKVGDQSLFVTPGGFGGSTTASPLTGGYKSTVGSDTGQGTGIAGQGFGLNFPAAGLSTTGSASLGLIYGTIGGNILEVQLSALQTAGKLNILSSPSLTTLDNQTAYTMNGQKIPFVRYDEKGQPIVDFQDAVLRLEITPHVIDEMTLKMNVMVKKDEVDTSHNVAGNPFITSKETKTTLVIQDGDTIVISGLTKQTKSDTMTGVPFLSNLPVIGWLFKSQSKSDQMDETLIFITPTIIKPPARSAIQEAPAAKGKEPLQ